MNKKQLEEIFTFPSGIDQLYGPRQDAIESNFFQLYEAAGLDIPRVFYFKSPLALQLAMNNLSGRWSRQKTDPDFIKEYPTFWNALLHEEIENRGKNRFFGEFISESVAANGAKHINDHASVLKELRRFGHLSMTIEKSVDEDMHRRLAIKGMEKMDLARHPHFGDISWLMTHRKFLDKFTHKERNLFLIYYELIRKGIMHCHLLEGAVLWCPLPTIFCLNDLKQLHCADGPALHWNDDYGLYFWNGVKVRKRIIELPESITRLDVLEEPDYEIRKCIQERIGARKFASLFNLVEVDRDSDLEGNQQFLWRTAHIDEFSHDYLYFAEVTSPNTLSTRFVEVPGGMSNVWEAVAWTFGNDRGANPAAIEV